MSLWLGGIALSVALLSGAPVLRAQSAGHAQTTPRDDAESQFDRAQKQRATLESAPEPQRTLAQYQQLVKAYRRVYLLTPRAPDVPFALLIVGDLNREMGDHFDLKYYQSAVDAYQFLLHEYPANRYREDALFAIAEIQKDNLNDRPLAQETFEEFLQLHPHSPRAADAKAALAELSAHRQVAKNTIPSAPAAVPPQAHPPVQTPVAVPAAAPVPATVTDNVTARTPASPPTQVNSGERFTEVMEPPSPGRTAEVHDIKTWVTPDYTRVVISLDGPVKYQAARITNPERIYFDVNQARLSHSVSSSPVTVQGDLLKGVRVAQNKDGVVRIVMEVAKVKTYSVFLLRDPYRMVVDIYSNAGTTSAVSTAKNSTPPQGEAAPNPSGTVANKTAAQQKPVKPAPAPVAAPTALDASSSRNTDASTTSAAVLRNPLPKSNINSSKTLHTASLKPIPMPAPTPPRDGQQSLTRALGLKIGRIVIDAGHGGRDTGTIGPGGLMEKDLCLDVALRLGKLLEDRLPGVEIVYTRSDDTFIPLEQRTTIANDAKADLFLSIHANSSPDPSARGVETYYLNFSPSPEAMQVAARENATAQNGVHDLEEMIQRIAQNEKIGESRDLAGDIQDSLTTRLQRANHGIKNRGVRKAPFVVLIGANMPSVLAEISFISNPTDEMSLSKPEGRDRVAEGLYKGIEEYLQSTNSLAVNQAKASPGGRTPGVASTGNQR